MGRFVFWKFCLLILLVAAPASAQESYTLFEAGPVRPLALSPDGTRLFVCNIPDSRLEIFAVSSDGLAPLRRIGARSFTMRGLKVLRRVGSRWGGTIRTASSRA